MSAPRHNSVRGERDRVAAAGERDGVGVCWLSRRPTAGSLKNPVTTSLEHSPVMGDIVARVRHVRRRCSIRRSAWRLPPRLLQRLVSRLRRALRFDPRDRDSLVSELHNEFERTAESFDVSTKSCDLAVIEIRTGFETRDVSLIDL